jgi:hypothetical protein
MLRSIRIAAAFALALLVFPASLAHAEGEGEAPLPCDATISGTLNAASPQFDRMAADAFTSSPACELPAFDSGYDGCAYAVLPFHSEVGGDFTAQVEPAFTTMQDSVLYLYCAPFDPQDPGKNLVAYNDDFRGGLLSALGPALSLSLVPDYTYYLVIATFNGIRPGEEGEGDAGENPDLGAYTVCLAPGYTFGEYSPNEGEITDPLACPIIAGYSQVLDQSFSATAYPSNNAAGRQIFELVTGVDDPITGIRWWGITGTQLNAFCDPTQLTYRVGFYEKSGLLPILNLNEFTAPPTVSETGTTLFGLPIYAYDLTFPEPVTLPNDEGFVSVYVSNTVNNCRFSWLSSAVGNGTSLYFNFSGLNYLSNPDDVAMCLITEPDCPGETSETADTLRVQLIDPLLSTVVGNATVTFNRLPNFSYPAEYDPVGGLFRVECLPFGTYTAVVAAPGYAPFETELLFQDPGAFETFFLQTAEGEGEGEGGGCKGCGFLTTVFVSVLNDDTEKGLTNARVRLTGTLLDITENVDGVYVLPTLSDGTYTLQVEANGFVTEQEIFSVSNDTVLGITVRMNPVQAAPVYDHTADEDANGRLNLSELLGIIQLYNFSRYHCEGDTFAPGQGDTDCTPHSCDYQPAVPDFVISLSELLRGIQLFTAQGYYDCPESEDGYCPGAP